MKAKLVIDRLDQEIGEHIVENVFEGFHEFELYSNYCKLTWNDWMGFKKRTEIVKFNSYDMLLVKDNGKFYHLLRSD